MSFELGRLSAVGVVESAVRRSAQLGHDNDGPLSFTHGFMYPRPPLHDLPPPYDVWVDAADELPQLVHSRRLHRRLEELPGLDADGLDERHLLRAASVVGLLNQAYCNTVTRRPGQLLPQLEGPWLQIAARLGRPPRTFTTTDFIFYNWQFIDPDAHDPMRSENLRLLTDIWDQPQLETFILVSLEILAQAAPLVGCVARAQEAVRHRDGDALKSELVVAAQTVQRLTQELLPKIDANERSGARRVDPLLWGKMFAMLPLPVPGADAVHNASGPEDPTFHLLDVFLGRQAYESHLGLEVQGFRSSYPANWAAYLRAVASEAVAAYVASSDDRELQGLFAELGESYHGYGGLLQRHALKAIGYIDMAFKTGRPSTVTGFSGLFEERPWEQVHASLEESRQERRLALPVRQRTARVERVEQIADEVHRIVLDVNGLGLQCRPGDRLAVLPRNDEQLVEATLRALRATGEEVVDLSSDWLGTLRQRGVPLSGSQAQLRDVLALGHLRPVPRHAAKLLFSLTHDQGLRTIVETRTEDQWELWDLLEMLAAGGFAPQRLWRAERGDFFSICRVVAPLAARLYSVSSIEGAPAATRIELTVGQLSYQSVVGATDVARQRSGTCSTYLCHTLASGPGEQVAVDVVRPPTFSLPSDASVPVVMFAGGTGVAPFRGFLQARVRAGATANVLFACARTPDALPYRTELEQYAKSGEAEVHFVYSRHPSQPRRIDDVCRDPEVAARLRELSSTARIYVCGRASFSRAVMDALAVALGEPGRPAREAVYDLVAAGRYAQDVFTSYTGSMQRPRTQVDASELASHRSADAGMWQAIGGRVYDVTDFAQIHPGGQKIMRSYAGMDASRSYRVVRHDRDPAVEAMLAIYENGIIRRLRFGSRWAIAVGDRGLEHLPLEELYRRWVRWLYLLVEMSNAHEVECSMQVEPLKRDELASGVALSPYRLQFGIETHARFLAQTVPLVCRRFAALWQTTSGPCSARASSRALWDDLAPLLDSDAARVAASRCDQLDSMADGEELSALDERVRVLAAADVDYLRVARNLVSDGVRLFELHEADVLRAAPDELLATLRHVPALTRGYFERVAGDAGPR